MRKAVLPAMRMKLLSSSQKSAWRVNCSWPLATLRDFPGETMTIVVGLLQETRRRLVERESRLMSLRRQARKEGKEKMLWCVDRRLV